MRTETRTGHVKRESCCSFPAGNMVWTSEGYKNIEDVTCNDYVLTHTGNYQRVIKTARTNMYDWYRIKISGCEEFLVTSRQPFYVRTKNSFTTRVHNKPIRKSWLGEPEWKEAQELDNTYRVGIRINQKEIIPQWDGCVYYRHNSFGITGSWWENKLSPYMDNEDFWWLVGRYFGDGNIPKKYAEGRKQSYSVDICCSNEEVPEITPVLERLGFEIHLRSQGSISHFNLANKELWQFLSQFGFGATEKAITPTILDLPDYHLKSYINGYLSADGCFDSQQSQWKFTTASRRLAYGMERCILKANGTVCSVVTRDNSDFIQGRKVNAHKAYQLSFCESYNRKRSQYLIENGICWVNIRSIEKLKSKQTTCYALTVANDETFTVNNIIVHQ